MATRGSERAAHWLALAVPAALMAGALIAQYGFGLPPCEMCWWQRYPHIAAIALAAGALAMAGSRLGAALLRLAALAIGISGLIGAYHAGVEYGWWEGLTTCSSTRLTGNPLDAIMAAPLVRCDTAAWTLAGISLAGFNFLISTAAAVAIALLATGRKGGA